MKRFLLFCVAPYLAVGLVFAIETQPQQIWYCPDPEAPHGEVAYGGPDAPPRDGCDPGITARERAEWVALATPLWAYFVGARALWPD